MSTRSLRVRQDWIERTKLAVRRSGFVNQRALSEESGLAIATVSNFLTGRPVDRATFVELCQKLSLQPEDIADLSAVEAQDQQQELGEARTQAPSTSPPTLHNTPTLDPQPQVPTTDWVKHWMFPCSMAVRRNLPPWSSGSAKIVADS